MRKCCWARSQVQAGNPSAWTNPFIRTCTATLVLSHNLICPHTLFRYFYSYSYSYSYYFWTCICICICISYAPEIVPRKWQKVMLSPCSVFSFSPLNHDCIRIRICILSPSVTWDQNWAGRQSVGDGSHYFRSISRLFTREDLRKGPLSNSPTQGNVTLAVDKVSQRKLWTTFHNVDFKNFLWTNWEMIRCTHDLSLWIAHQKKLCSCFGPIFIEPKYDHCPPM